MNIVIYGAQGIALSAYKTLKEVFPESKVLGFLVSQIVGNPRNLAGLPVYELHTFVSEMSQEVKDNIQVLIATPENVMEDIELNLKEAGMYCYMRVDSARLSQMMEIYFLKNRDYLPLSSYPVGRNKAVLKVYKAKFYKDKVLRTVITNPDYMMDIQVGADRTTERVATIVDNYGDNISMKNGNYSELTGLYWIWKNSILTDTNNKESYYGLAHYRRSFRLSKEDLLRLKDNEIDAILPYPLAYEPNIEEHHKRYLSDIEWNTLLQALEELEPEYALALQDILKQEYLYNYNIIVAKGNVLNDYCSWLFPILFRVEELNPDNIKEPNRFIGYIAETLETLYFMHHKKNLKIAHTGCTFLM